MANIYVVFQHIGYKRHPSIKNKLIIDEQVKDIVEKIFDMYANGQGSVEIVNFYVMSCFNIISSESR